MVSRKELIERMAKRMATVEGFGKPNVPPTRNNNPGNLRSWGSYPVVKGFAVFPTVEEGWKALHKQIEKNVFTRGLTFFEFFAGQRDASGKVRSGGYPGYAPAADQNNPKQYAGYVANEFHVPIDTVIKTLVDKV